LKIIQKYYSKLSEITKKEENQQQSHSIDESEELNEIKRGRVIKLILIS